MPSLALITGATGGLGKAFVAACAARGWDLLLLGRSPERLEALATATAREFGVQAWTYACDLTDEAARDALWAFAVEHDLRFHLLINVAGVEFEGPFAKTTEAQLATIVRLNVEAVTAMTHGVLAHRDPWCTLRIINVSSLAAYSPMPAKAVYAASKRYILNLSLALREELREQDVTVTALCSAGLPTTDFCIQAIAVQGVMGQLTTCNVGRVAARTVEQALRGSAVYIPGFLNRLMALAAAILPGSATAALVRRRWRAAWSEPCAPTVARAPVRLPAAPEAPQNLAGKTMVVTGATDGIGAATAAALAARGARVMGVGRSAERCAAAQATIHAAHPNADVTFLCADLSAQRGVRALAQEIAATMQRAGAPGLDALIHCAGAVSSWFAATEDGYERQFAVNHLAPFLLTHLLLPHLQAASGAGRVVIVGSRQHRWGQMHWQDVMLRQRYQLLRAYAQSKLANVLFAMEFNRRHGAVDGVRTWVADPGLVRTAIGLKETHGLERRFWAWRSAKGRPPQEAGAHIVALAADPAVAQEAAVYWRDGAPLAPSAYAQEAEPAARLWELSARLCGLEDGVRAERQGA